MSSVTKYATMGIVNGNYIGLTYILITIGELWVSAIGLSMIGMYCDKDNLAFAMGVWLLGSSLSNTISGRIAKYVALPTDSTPAAESLAIFKSYYFIIGTTTCIIAVVMFIIAKYIKLTAKNRAISIN
jgi:POT family proton-dependent oligopeptide transporter